MLNSLNDEAILEVYFETVKLNLAINFIKILKAELDIRGISAEFKKVD